MPTCETHSIETILAELANSGWLVYTCSQCADLSWVANLRNSDWQITDYGRGSTMFEALDEAIALTHTAEKLEIDRASVSYSLEPAINLASLLRPPIKITRRI
jgi:hypothetical protein